MQENHCLGHNSATKIEKNRKKTIGKIPLNAIKMGPKNTQK